MSVVKRRYKTYQKQTAAEDKVVDRHSSWSDKVSANSGYTATQRLLREGDVRHSTKPRVSMKEELCKERTGIRVGPLRYIWCPSFIVRAISNLQSDGVGIRYEGD